MLRVHTVATLFWAMTLGLTPGDQGSASPERARPVAPQRDEVLVLGRIDAREVGPYAGASITVYRVERGGKLKQITSRSVLSDKDGRYQALIHINNLNSESSVDLVIRATHGDSKGAGATLVGTWSAVDHVIVAPAIDLESALTTDLYLRMMASGVDVSRFGYNTLRRIVTPRMASELHSNASYESALPQVTRATLSAVSAWMHVLTGGDLDVRPESVKLALDALDWAQVMLDAELYASDSPEETEKAHQDYEELAGAAYASAGVTPEHLAAAAQAAADAMRFQATTVSGRMRAALISEAEGLRARYVTSAVEELMSRNGADESDSRAVHDAGQQLESRIFASIDAGKDIDDTVRAAWSDYRQFVVGRLRSMAAEARGQSLM
jgi:hypothetical protein